MVKQTERMQSRDGEAAENVGPTKRLRRPNVRLNQPYFEISCHPKLQKRWNAFKKDLEGAKKARNKKNDGMNNEDEIDSDDDVAIVNWKREKGFNSKSKRKRKNQENEDFQLSSGGESEKQGEDEKKVEEEEENLGVDGVGTNSEPEKSDPSSPIPDEKLSDNDDDNNNVGDNNQAIRQTGQDSDIRIDRDRNGVEEWLNQLGLGKYAYLFEVHEVDDDVLPFLTLEDLKDMGISAVGSRRKMFRSIQKLGKGFSS